MAVCPSPCPCPNCLHLHQWDAAGNPAEEGERRGRTQTQLLLQDWRPGPQAAEDGAGPRLQAGTTASGHRQGGTSSVSQPQSCPQHSLQALTHLFSLPVSQPWRIHLLGTLSKTKPRNLSASHGTPPPTRTQNFSSDPQMPFTLRHSFFVNYLSEACGV